MTAMPLSPLFAGILAIGLAATLPAGAATQAKTYDYSPGDACQLSIPTTDTKVRPRANGYRNEGTSSQFVICGMGGYENDTVTAMSLRFTAMDGIARSMSCTGYTGLPGWPGGVHYSTKTVSVPATGYGSQSWTASDFGGNAGEVIFGGLNLSVTCTLPPNVALQGFESQGLIDVGN